MKQKLLVAMIAVVVGLSLAQKVDITKKLVNWFSEKVEQIQERGIGDFSRDFGPVEMSLMGGVRFDKSGHLIVVLQRKGEPGKNWPRWCER